MKKAQSFWQRLVSRVRRVFTGEAVGADDPGYLVSPLDIFDGQKGIDHSFYAMLAAWRRRCGPGQGPPPGAATGRAHARDTARLLEMTNPFAQSILSALRSYVLADQGMVVELAAREGAGVDEDNPLLTDAQAYLDEFLDRDDWWSRERELFTRCHRDGEGIVRYFADSDGVRIRFVEPECIVPPDASPEWCEGVRTDPDDAETLEALWVQTGQTPQDGEELSATEVYVIRCNVDRCLKRGLSDFASMTPLVTKALDCLSSMLGAEAIRQGIVMITHHEQSAPADLDAFIAGQADYLDRSHQGQDSGPARAVPTQAVSSVREVHLTGAQKLAALPPVGSVQDATNAINTALLSAAARYHMPLWVVSGDASRNNAMDLQAEGPFGKYIADEQQWYGRHVRNILWRVLEIGVDRGEVAAAALDLLELHVSPQRPTEQRDPTKETERNATLHEAGVMGLPTWSAREGLDFEDEQEDLKRYNPPPPAPVAPAPVPGGTPSPPAGNGNGQGVNRLEELLLATVASEAMGKGGQFKKGGGRETGHGYSKGEIDSMSHGQRKVLAGTLGHAVKGKSEDEVKALLHQGATDAGGPAPSTPTTPAAVAPKAEALPKEQHAAAVKDLLAAVQKGDREGGADPRGDLAHLPVGGRLEGIKTMAGEMVADHVKRTTVGMPLHDLHAALGRLPPEEFRAVLLHMHGRGEVRLSGWSKMPEDHPRPDLMPVVSGKVMGYANQGKEVAAGQSVSPISGQTPAGRLAGAGAGKDFDAAAVHNDLKRLSAPDRRGVMPTVPDLYDRLKQDHPGLTEPAFHALLFDLAKQGKATLQQWDTSVPVEKTGHGRSRFPDHPRGGPVGFVRLH